MFTIILYSKRTVMFDNNSNISHRVFKCMFSIQFASKLYETNSEKKCLNSVPLSSIILMLTKSV
jgi:hypothetical protein